MPFQIIRNDITKVKADAIVNTANPNPQIGGGTDKAIYAAAGWRKLLAQRKKIGTILPGQAVSTNAFRLPAKYVIHTVGPAWIDGAHGEREILHACYENSLALADRLNCKSIAFPLIATGVYGFPKDAALNIALSEIGRFLLTHEMEVFLVVFDQSALELSQKLVGEIEQYIDEHTAHSLLEEEYAMPSSADICFHEIGNPEPLGQRRAFAREPERSAAPKTAPKPILHRTPLANASANLPADTVLPAGSALSLSDVLETKEQTFQQRLFSLIDQRGLDDVTVYKKANIDRKLFSRIRCKPDYKPTKKTAVAFAIALELDLPTTKDLLSRAELAFSPTSRFDLIVMYFITNKNYDIYQINAALFQYHQPTLGV